MRKPGLAELTALVEVSQRRSFAQAAAHLGMSRSALSESIRNLEDRLGVRLLNRTTRSVAPTEAGERLLQQLQPLLLDVNAALDSVNAFRARPAGLLRLTVAPPAADHVVAPVLAKFMAAYPDIKVEIAVDSALTDIVRERFDAGIRVGERIARDMIALPLRGETRPVVVAAPSYLKAHGRPRTPQDLRHHNCIRVRFPSGAIMGWFFEKGGKRIEVAVEGNLILNATAMILRAALDGVGLAHVMAEDAAPHVKARKLVPVLEDWSLPGPQFSLYYPSRRQNPATLQAFIGFLRSAGYLAPAAKAAS